MINPSPITFTTSPSIPPTLHLPRSTFLSARPQLKALLASALVFRQHTPTPSAVPSTNSIPPKPQLQTLILRRALNDSYPLKWEKPGGSAKSTDTSVLHSVARELYEETGLRAKHMHCPIGIGNESEYKGLTSGWMWGIDPEVEKAVEIEGDEARTVGLMESGGLWGVVTVIVEVEEDLGLDAVVRVEPDEHVEFKWVSEEEVRCGRGEDGERLEFIGEAVWRVLLEGFRVKREMEGMGDGVV